MSIKQPGEASDFQASIRQQLETIVAETKVKNVDIDKLVTQFAEHAERMGIKKPLIEIQLGTSPENPLTFVLKEGDLEPELTGHTPNYGWLESNKTQAEMDAATYRTLILDALGEEQGKPRSEGAGFRASIRVDKE